MDEAAEAERKEKLKILNKSRPLGPRLKQNLSDIRGVAPGSTITYTVSPLSTAIGMEAIDAKRIKEKYGLAGGKKKRRRRRTKKKKRKRRKRNLKKRTRRRRRKSKRRRRR